MIRALCFSLVLGAGCLFASTAEAGCPSYGGYGGYSYRPYTSHYGGYGAYYGSPYRGHSYHHGHGSFHIHGRHFGIGFGY